MVLAIAFCTSLPARASAEGEAAPAATPAPVLSRPAGEAGAFKDRGRFASLWVVPLASHEFQGAGLEAGYWHHHLAGLVREGFVQNGYAPADGAALVRTRRVFFEVEVDGQWTFHDGPTLALGGGAAYVDDRVDRSLLDAAGWHTSTDQRIRVRPLVSLTLTGPVIEIAFIGALGADPEVRVSLGISWGRIARRL